ncbi:hypothetical protein [Alteromonas sp. RKMC-009]|uniref:hypothetical protein n=1 Tax=Alteromonas sp. RKMC-009 TaxID=2267264 RepID=UPI000E677F32|nr:hypothetical protein [Alteromonas sp. RKMC-009]AYA64293.3 hypothetical protein DS731_09960 [Alteromonas sp. RKMC-009]
MKALTLMAINSVIAHADAVVRTLNDSDNLHDLQMYIDSKGDCEVTLGEASQLMHALVVQHAQIEELINQALTTLDAMRKDYSS